MKRKTPVRHIVKLHKRGNKFVRSYPRGRGEKLVKPGVSPVFTKSKIPLKSAFSILINEADIRVGETYLLGAYSDPGDPRASMSRAARIKILGIVSEGEYEIEYLDSLPDDSGEGPVPKGTVDVIEFSRKRNENFYDIFALPGKGYKPRVVRETEHRQDDFEKLVEMVKKKDPSFKFHGLVYSYERFDDKAKPMAYGPEGYGSYTDREVEREATNIRRVSPEAERVFRAMVEKSRRTYRAKW